MTKTLTEQWKKGELLENHEYWVVLTDEWYLQNPVKPVRAFYSCDCEFEGYLDDDIKEVLAPVPDYMGCKRLMNDSIDLDKAKIKIYELVSKTEQLEKQLSIATKALKKIIRDYEINGIGYLCVTRAKEALKEMEGVK